MDIERIKDCMERSRLSQSELARQVGVTQGAIQQILSGATQRSRALPDIARILGVSVPYLLGESDDPDDKLFDQYDPDSDPLSKDVRITSIRCEDLSTWGFGPSSGLDGTWNWTHFDTEFLSKITESPAGKLSLVEDLDDSMAPTFHPTDQVLVDLNQVNVFDQDKIWLLNASGINVFRRVRRLPGGMLRIMADNPPIAPYDVSEADLTVNGRAIWIGRNIK